MGTQDTLGADKAADHGEVIRLGITCEELAAHVYEVVGEWGVTGEELVAHLYKVIGVDEAVNEAAVRYVAEQ